MKVHSCLVGVVPTDDLVVLHVRELLLAVQADELGLALHDVHAVDGPDGEVVAGQREDFLAQGQSHFARVVESGTGRLGTQGRGDCCEGWWHCCCLYAECVGFWLFGCMRRNG